MGRPSNNLKLIGLFLLCLGTASALDIKHANENADQDSKANTDDIHFYLWTTSNSGDDEYFELIYGDSGRLLGSPFDPSRKTYIMSHGYISNGFTQFVLDGKTKILSLQDANVISIDWGAYAFNPDYWASANKVYIVGPYAGQFIDWVVSETGLSTTDIELIGHSLGAHLVGMAAQEVSSGEISRITGLDPAGPAFYDATITERLDKTQATYVDIIHTNGGQLDASCYGMITAIGHTDFYVNGGTRQPGCFGLDPVGCSHNRSHDIWVESITAGPAYTGGSGSTNLLFQAWPCADWDTFDEGSCTSCGSGCANMGFHNNNGPYGSYFLRTYESSPYAYGVAQ